MKPRHLNVGLDHLLQIETGEELANIEYGLPNVQLFRVEMVNYYYVK